MKKFAAILFAAMMLLAVMTAVAEEKTVMNWAYGAMPLNNGNVGTIYDSPDIRCCKNQKPLYTVVRNTFNHCIW